MFPSLSFERTYPVSAARFDLSLAGWRRWQQDCADRNLVASGLVRLLCEDLLVYAASWYNDYNLFHTPKFSVKFQITRNEFNNMAHTTKRNNQEKKAPWLGFLDFRLSEGQLSECDGWQPSPMEIWSSVDTLITTGYKVTLSYSSRTQNATCTIMDESPERKAGGWGLSSADRDGAAALKMAIYKHFIALEGSWDTILDLPASAGRRG